MSKLLEKNISTIIIIYFLIGIVFAISFALFYHWGGLTFFSPNFYVVVFSWPIQIFGFISDFQTYGFAGKVLI